MACFLKYFLGLLLLLTCSVVSAEQDNQARASFRVTPLSLSGGSTLKLVSPNEWYPLAKKLSSYLNKTHNDFRKIYGEIPPVETTLRLVDSEQFYEETGAPAWTNAMYYRGEITIPLAPNQTIELEDLYRSIKHEYTHATINALSGGRCPGWLDEGLAQWSEGSVNPALEPSLRKWLYFNPPVPLDLLQGGFTKLDVDMVPPAYAQSLYATKIVIKSFGFDKIKHFFSRLRSGDEKNLAFKRSFKVSEDGFENSLTKSLKKWAFDDNRIALNTVVYHQEE